MAYTILGGRGRRNENEGHVPGVIVNVMTARKTTNHPASIVWFRHDLRLDDNPALHAAVARGGSIVPVFIWAPHEEAPWEPGAASRWWLHQSLRHLDADLHRHGSRLIIRHGTSPRELLMLADACGADTVYWNRRYEPAAALRDAAVTARLAEAGIAAETRNGSLLVEPWDVATRQGRPFQVFTPFYRRIAELEYPEPTAAPPRIPAPPRWPESLDLRDLMLEPAVDWAAGIRAAWQPGSKGARRALDHFLETDLAGYAAGRDAMDIAGTSRLSPHLHFGEISPRTVWHAVRAAAAIETSPGIIEGQDAYLRQLAWREFAHHLLHHFPHTVEQPLKPEFAKFPWRYDERALQAWRQGRTGYPLVDAGMRELWTTGWMHNRARLVAASFLVKHLLIRWQDGARWFWDTLVDADLANNTLGWQWVAGCGADAAPYFRVFNPTLQGDRFDATGAYVRRWAPELALMPAKWIHEPSKAPEPVLRTARVQLGQTYPMPIIEHEKARVRALAAYETITRGRP